MINWFKCSFLDESGKPSAKRITLCIAVLMICQMAVGQQYFGKIIPEHIYDSFMVMVISGTGFVGIEKYISLYKNNQETPKQ